MSKELEAWNFIKEQMQNFTFSHLVTEMVKNADIVEQALQRLGQIENASPSKALKAFEDFKDISLEGFVLITPDLQRLNTIKQALLEAQEQEKVLEIMFEKTIVDIKWLKVSRNYKEYNSKILDIYDLSSLLTEEEFNTLKEYANEITRVKD